MSQGEKKLSLKIDRYVVDWHWDEASKAYAFEMGKLLFAFIDYLNEQDLSERTLKKHRNNVWLIGWLEAGYGYNKVFFPENLAGAMPGFPFEFKRKVSESPYSAQSYQSTCRKLDHFIQSGAFTEYLKRIESELKKDEQGS